MEIDHLLCFKKCKYKSSFICSCSESEIHSLCKLINLFLKGKLQIRNQQQIIEKLAPIKRVLRILADKRITTKTKRKLFIQSAIQDILFPIISSRDRMLDQTNILCMKSYNCFIKTNYV